MPVLKVYEKKNVWDSICKGNKEYKINKFLQDYYSIKIITQRIQR